MAITRTVTPKGLIFEYDPDDAGPWDLPVADPRGWAARVRRIEDGVAIYTWVRMSIDDRRVG